MKEDKLDFSIEDDLNLALEIAARVFAFLSAEAARSGKTPREVLEAHITKRQAADEKMTAFLESLPQ